MIIISDIINGLRWYKVLKYYISDRKNCVQIFEFLRDLNKDIFNELFIKNGNTIIF